MTLRWPDDPRWSALLAPVRTVIERARERLEPRPDTLRPVVAGTPGVVVEVRPDALALDPALLDGRHPTDAAWMARMPEELHGLALDRWRRAAAAVLEGAALSALAEEAPPGERHPDEGGGAPAWWRPARAAEAVDRAAPELGLLWPALADWLATPGRGIDADPHRGAWFVRWRRLSGGGAAWVAPTAEEWLAFGAWLSDRAPADAPLPLPCTAVAPGAWTAAPYSFRHVRVDAGPAGARVWATGAAVTGRSAELVRIPGGERATVLVATLAGGPASVEAAPAGPVGTWVVRAGRRAERVGAARGMELTLHADGTGEVTLADAFLGPATGGALDLASRFGVSGLLVGSWRLVAFVGDTHDPVVELGPVRPEAVTVHPRGHRGFAMPAGPILGAAEGWLERAAGTRWRVRQAPDGIEAVGTDLGATVTLVFTRA